MKLITGMHRSGTSLVARLLHEAGGDFGNPATFYPADRWNPDGYFEQRDIHAINMPLIHGRWGRLAYLRLPSEAIILERANKMNPRITDAIRKYETAIVKETRFSLTLPAWIEHGLNVEKILICLRDPIAVARSLKKRNRIPETLGVSLWVEHYRRLLRSVGDIPCRFIDYNELMEEERFVREMKPALKFMGLDASVERLIELFRTCVTPKTISPPIFPSRAIRLWEELKQRHAKQFIDSGEAHSDCSPRNTIL